MVRVFITYYSIMNVLGFILMAIDKLQAKRHKGRVPEKYLLIIAVLGGGFGVTNAMLLCHHKLSKPRFYMMAPLVTTLQLIALLYCLVYLRQ